MGMKLSRRDLLLWLGAVGAAGCGEMSLSDGLRPVSVLPDFDSLFPPVANWDEGNMTTPARGALPFFDPLVLSADCVVINDASPNVAALKNPAGLAMEILAIRFRAYPDNTGAYGNGVITGTPTVSGLGVGVKLDLGSIPVVDAGVPISLFGNARDDNAEDTTAYLVAPANNSLTAYCEEYLWRLKYPLFIPAGAVLAPTFTNLKQTTLPIKVQITYFCRGYSRDAAAPNNPWVPWVTSYRSKSFDVLTGTNAIDYDSSSETDIYNPFAVPVELAKITGRANFYALSASEAWTQSNFETYFSPDQVLKRVKVEISGSRGDDIVRNPTVFGTLFPYNWKAWDVPGKFAMQPGEFWNVRLTRDAFSDVGTSSQGRQQFAIGVVGYRRIDGTGFAGGVE